MVKRSWKSFLAGVALFGGMAMANTAFAGGEGCTPCGGMDCHQCEQIFADAGQKLTDQLASMSCCGTCGDTSCCAPAGCCEAGGDICGDLGCGEGCGDGCGEGCSLFGEGSGIEIGGWVQSGYHSKSNGLFNDRPDEFNLHQAWLYAEKAADGSKGVDWGFRADVMYGIDAGDTQAFGNNPGRWDFQNGFDHGAYGWAIPQLYGEIAMGDLSVIAGHFYTLIGYEVVTAPDNFFYSHAYTMYNSEPFTHTGVLATYAASDNLEVYAGWTAGWDTGFDRRNGGSSFLGGFSTSVSDDVSFTYITTAGNFGDIGDNGYSHSLVLDFTLTDDLNYVLQSDLKRVGSTSDEDVGINQYLFYTINDQLAAGTRVEWWKDDGTSFYETTWGLNVKPMDNVIVRPEVRHEWQPGGGPDQTIFGVDAIITF
jgi:hypothetical protein